MKTLGKFLDGIQQEIKILNDVQFVAEVLSPRVPGIRYREGFAIDEYPYLVVEVDTDEMAQDILGIVESRVMYVRSSLGFRDDDTPIGSVQKPFTLGRIKHFWEGMREPEVGFGILHRLTKDSHVIVREQNGPFKGMSIRLGCNVVHVPIYLVIMLDDDIEMVLDDYFMFHNSGKYANSPVTTLYWR